MALRVQKVTSENVDKFLDDIVKTMTIEYVNTYYENPGDGYKDGLRSYCIHHTYILTFYSPRTAKEVLIGYFSLAQYDLNKNFAVFEFIYNWVRGCIFMFDVFVFPVYRYKGIGTYLVNQATGIAKSKHNARKVQLFTDTIDLSRFYNRNGFQVINQIYVKIPDSSMKKLYLHELVL
jgi:GNAT superfamily N-acetyltransferase